jgi:3-deoxy-D-manno-octulosonate 8-phosphate phosphatase KdsC-like HAD superfamily phosphatase|tara:strand:+ start:2620 stop:2787 length:168 start_codon:yes stop_codon:yes gene_type:complete
MIEALALAASMLTCQESQTLIDRVNEYAIRNQGSEAYVQEVIDVIKEDNSECKFK